MLAASLRSMRNLQKLGVFFVLTLSQICFSQTAQKSTHVSKTDRTTGRNTFNAECAACHGLDGHGSDKAVNISANTRAQHLSDAELSSIVSNGIPEAGMPSFPSLSATGVREVIAYLRSLQGKGEARTVPGDATHGREIFFGKGDCGSCHMISGKGGFLGPDLTNYAATASAEGIRGEIVKTRRSPSHGRRLAAITTTQGERLEGIIRNEDNFSIQLQTQDGSFHFFRKTDIRSFENVPGSFMPANYGEKLSESELNDLVNYLTTTPDPSKATLSKTNGDFE